MPNSTPATILVVDDDQDVADLYADWLGATYDVQTVYGGETALEQLDETVDIVLLDRRMPDLSGDDVISIIRERGLSCRVALVTSIEPDLDILELGFDDYLQKPVTETTLHELVETLLTRLHYSDRLREYAALLSKQATLQADTESAELLNSPEFERLQTQIDEVEAEVETLQEDFEEEDFIAAFHDIP